MRSLGRRTWSLVVAGSVLLWVAGLAARGAAVRPIRQPAASYAALAEERRIREADIEFYLQRIERDPTGALDLVRLGKLYLERYRASGDERDLAGAEAAARRSLSNRAERNA